MGSFEYTQDTGTLSITNSVDNPPHILLVIIEPHEESVPHDRLQLRKSRSFRVVLMWHSA